MTPQQQQLDDNGFPEFEPVRIYDAPATILTQIYDGEGSLGRAIRTIMSQESLSPAERDSYAQRLKKAHGGNPVMDTTIDLAMNPLVWLLFLTSPIGRGQFIKTGGKLIQGLGEIDKSKFAGRAFGKVAELFRLTPFASLVGMQETTAPSEIVQSVTSRLLKLQQKQADVVGAARGKLVEALKAKHGVTDFDPTRPANPETRAFLEELNLLSHMWASGSLDGGTTNFPKVGFTRVAKLKVGGREIARTLTEAEYQQVKSKLSVGAKITDAAGVEHELLSVPITVDDRDTLRAAHDLIRSVHGPRAELPKYRVLEDDVQNIFNVEGLDKDLAMKWARRNGVEEEFANYAKAGEEYRLEMKKYMFGVLGPNNELPPNFQIDPEKVARVWMRAQRGNKKNPTLEEWTLDSLVGMDTIDRILPEWAKEALRRGTPGIKLDDVYDLIRKTLGPQMESAYMPRNTFSLYGKEKGKLVGIGPTDADAILRGRGAKDVMEVPGVALPRRGNALPVDPNDLKIIERLIGNRKANVVVPGYQDATLEEVMARTNNELQRVTTGRVATHTFNHELAMRHYVGDMHSAIGLHALEITPALRETVLGAVRRPRAQQLAGSRLNEVNELSTTTKRRLKQMGVDPELMTGNEYTVPETLQTHELAPGLRGDLRQAHQRLKTFTDIASPTPRQLEAIQSLKRRINSLQNDLRILGQTSLRPDVALLGETTPTRLSMADAIDVVMGRESPATREYFEKGVLPSLFGGTKPTQMFGLQMSQQARNLALSTANSAPAKWIENNGGYLGKAMVKQMRDYGNMSAYELDAAHAAGGLTGYLYATHLGFNMASAAWNMLQPFQWAATWMGSPEIIKAYGTALKQMGGYLAERAKHPLRIDPQTQMELWQKHIRLAGKESYGRDLIGITPGVMSTFESAVYSKPPEGKPGLLRFLTIDAPLKLFQTAEALNRIVVAEAGYSWYNKMQKGTGMNIPTSRVLDHIQELQSMVNFSYSPATQMKMFQKGEVLGNPFLRMFLQYPSRTIGNFMLSQQMGGGVREFGLQKIGGPVFGEIPALAGDAMRILGLSAVGYEVGKNLLGLDLSPGLSGAAISQLPNQFFTKGIPVPPVIDIPVQLVGGLLQGDQEQIRQAAFRLVPGGVTLQKALGALPAVPGGGPFGLLQSQYADWGNRTPEGQVPVYRDDGTLQSFDSPLNLVMRGIGADFKKFQSPMEATKFLLANRAEMVDMRRKYKDAVLGNNMSGAGVIEAEYKKRYGVPMTVKPSEWDRAVQLRSAPLAERMLDTMPADMREQYQQSLSGMSEQFGLPPGGLENSDTARQRQSIRQFNPSFNVPGQ